MLGHIGIEVPDVEKACKRFEKLGVKFVKKPNDGTSCCFQVKCIVVNVNCYMFSTGKMKGLAFIKDPDGYWIEILNSDNLSQMLGKNS